jgi:hypothetical protein
LYFSSCFDEGNCPTVSAGVLSGDCPTVVRSRRPGRGPKNAGNEIDEWERVRNREMTRLGLQPIALAEQRGKGNS